MHRNASHICCIVPFLTVMTAAAIGGIVVWHYLNELISLPLL